MVDVKFPRELNGEELADIFEEVGKELGHVTQREVAHRYVPNSVKKEEKLIRVTSKEYLKKGFVDRVLNAFEWLLPCDGPLLYIGFRAEIEPTKKYGAIDVEVFEHSADSTPGHGDSYLGNYDPRLETYKPSIHKFVQGIMGRLGRMPL